MADRALRKIVFFLPLPDPLGLTDGSTYTFEHEGELGWPGLAGTMLTEGVTVHQATSVPRFSSLRVWQTPVRGEPAEFDPQAAVADVLPRALPPNAPTLAVAGTGVGPTDLPAPARSASTTVRSRTGSSASVTMLEPDHDSDGVSEAFDLCFSSLLDLLAAYRTATRHLIPTLTRERLPVAVLWVGGEPDGSRWDDSVSLLVLHANAPFTPDELSAQDSRFVGQHLEARRRRHPAVAYQERRLEALALLAKDGQLAAAVLQAHVAYEVFSDALVSLLMWESGADATDSHAFFRDRGTAHQRLSSVGSRLVRPAWDHRDLPSVLRRWYATASSLRNRIVHAGYEPTRAEVLAVLDEHALLRDVAQWRDELDLLRWGGSA